MNYKRPLTLIVLSIVSSVAFVTEPCRAQSPQAHPPVSDRMDGNWMGTLDAGPVKLRLLVNITTDADGQLSGTMDSIDQGAKNLPIDSMSLEEGTLQFEMKQIGGSYEGTLSDDRMQLDGTWTQAGASLPLVLKRTGEEIALNRPQEPQPPFLYDIEEVVVENKEADVKLAGTLTIPRDGRPVPAAILISGSGPQDRDESLMGHKPFWVLADHLSRKGIAVLRLDDRGVGGSTGDLFKSTDEDLARDALQAVAFLRERKEVDPQQVGLIGHSEGGIIAPLAATQSDDVAFIVLMAGTGVTGEEILDMQQVLIAKSMGASEETIKRNRELNKKMIAMVKQGSEGEVADKLKELLNDHIASLPDEERKKAEAMRSLTEANFRLVDTPWFRYFVNHDPRPVLRQVKCPVLAIIGENDLQVPPEENLTEIEAALDAGGNKDYTVKQLDGLNHLFQTSQTGAISEYGMIEETIAPQALELISNWILERSEDQ